MRLANNVMRAAALCATIVLGAIQQPIAAQKGPSVRTIERSGVPLANRVSAGDDIVVVRWQPLTVESNNSGSRREVLGQAVSSARVVALVDVAQAAAELADEGTWIETRLTGKVHEVLKADQATPGRSLANGSPLSLRVTGGQLNIGNVLVKSEGAVDYPGNRRYLVFLGQRDEIAGDWLAGHHPMLVAGQSLISVSAPGQSRLDGATLRDVVDAIQRGGR